MGHPRYVEYTLSKCFVNMPHLEEHGHSEKHTAYLRFYKLYKTTIVEKVMLASHGFSLTSSANGQIGEGNRNMTPSTLRSLAELTRGSSRPE